MLSAETLAGAPPATSQFAATHTPAVTQSPSGRVSMQRAGSGLAPGVNPPPPGGSLFDGLAVEFTEPSVAPQTSPAARQSAKHVPAVSGSSPGQGSGTGSGFQSVAPNRTDLSAPTPTLIAHEQGSFSPPSITAAARSTGSVLDPAPSNGSGGMFSGLDLVSDEAVADPFGLPTPQQRLSRDASMDSTVVSEAAAPRFSAAGLSPFAQGGGLSHQGSAGDALADLLAPPGTLTAGVYRCLTWVSLSALRYALR